MRKKESLYKALLMRAFVSDSLTDDEPHQLTTNHLYNPIRQELSVKVPLFSDYPHIVEQIASNDVWEIARKHYFPMVLFPIYIVYDVDYSYGSDSFLG